MSKEFFWITKVVPGLYRHSSDGNLISAFDIIRSLSDDKINLEKQWDEISEKTDSLRLVKYMCFEGDNEPTPALTADQCMGLPHIIKGERAQELSRISIQAYLQILGGQMPDPNSFIIN